MRTLVLILAWLTPPIIGGMFGWSGIWGGGSAFVDYIIPIPVAGGSLHVPSFIALAIFTVVVSKMHTPASRFMAPLIFSVFAITLAAMLEFDRLSAWLFTDYQPAASPLRLDANPLFLFIASDAFWGGVYALKKCQAAPLKSWIAVPVMPVLMVVAVLFFQQASGPRFEVGTGFPGSERGEPTRMVYTSSPYDKALFQAWLEERSYSFPWNNINVEHEAIIFTRSMQTIKWGVRDSEVIQGPDTIATFCLYEEDESITAHQGYHDCFADREVFEETIARLLVTEAPGLGRDIDNWYANIRLCDDVDMNQTNSDLARPSRCEGIYRVYQRDLERFIAKYGEDSPQVTFVREQAEARRL